MRQYIITILCLFCGLSARSQSAPTPEQAGSIYYAYPTPPEVSTPAPAGYEPFYISHYGRHGSRWMTADERYTEVVSVFDSLYRCSGLTPLGIDVRGRLHKVWEDARGCSGSITPLGERQHREIAGRMFRNFPQVFRADARIDARSSTSVRCVLSMSYFTERLKELNPALRVDRRAYHRYMDYIAYTSPEGEKFASEKAPWRSDFREFEKKNVRPERLMASLFTNPSAIADPDAMMRSLYWIAADMQNVELDLSFYDIFEYEELIGVWKTVNARMYVCNAAAPLNGGLMPRQAVPLLRNILESADAAIRKGTPAADLRFGHDTHLIRLLALMQIEGCSNRETDMEKFHLAWQDYRVSPMGANLQLVFYRNKKNDVLVKFLLNENEVTLPIKSGKAPYYSWEEVKTFLGKQAE
ncbi:histidine-type phosphatase [Bacteroides stercorirosoris]|uniref:Multiple inositol polyphosphate phosphatase 1 n=1 Tax=Bacteroides stercorirosoris TaxID=871324 RepID=A0A1M6A732_9BACE|nr:histidine-type phosphatase [Bacteroides stercorirosoris]OKZ06798.1 MAG: histidine phosphatase family protein [Bacteroides oleiciplenus]SHI32301.1 Histidine phosphatase superfamily (branch 2) [Bacteroides stercorirosoris]